jgi:DNA-binding MarR family transcriptional regulator
VRCPYWIMNGHDDDQVARRAGLQRDADLTFFEYMVLATLSEQPGRTMRMSELAANISASLSLLSHVASRLEARGYLTRQRCAVPGRAANATLTGTGYAKVAAAEPGHLQAVRGYLIDISTPGELRSLAAIGDRDRPGPGRTWHLRQQ